MRFLLDTSAIIRFARGNRASVNRIDYLVERGEELGCCDITIAEFYSGAPYGRDRRWDRLMDLLDYWPTTRDAAMLAASFRRDARRRNRMLGLADVIVAAVAVEQSATLLTANPRDFQLPGLEVEAFP
jgi:predicted nucleic acid-binding protein